ncbi:MAG: DUF349 domain-containing protein [Bacteroidales bacterium]|jgi:hypothetical protein
MENNDIQNLELHDDELNQEMKTEQQETQAVLTEQKAETEQPAILSETNQPDIETVAEEAKKSEKETEKLISDIEKSQSIPEEIDVEAMSRRELADLLIETVKVDDVNTVKNEVALIKVTFLKKDKEHREALLEKFIIDGGKKEEFEHTPDLQTERFNAAFEIYKEKRARHNENLEKQKQDNLALKIKILDDLKQLVESDEELKKTYDAFKTLQERWKEIGQVPKAEINNLWQNYNFLVEKFFDKVKINKELKYLDLKKNLEAKIELCEKTEELLLENSITKSFRQLQKYHDMWHEIGPVPQDKNDEIWERFRTASDKINERRREYYDNVKVEQEKNIETKSALCEKAEQVAEMVITTAKDWQEQSTVLNDMLKAWKTVGPAPKEENDKLWARFKTAIDNFFHAKNEFYGKLKDEQVTNYNQKLNLCLQAEAIKNSQDWRRTTEELIRIQQEWKKIGPVPRKYSDKTWLRFRAACDEFFSAKSNYFANIGSIEEENLKQKQELIKQLNEYSFGENKNENLQIIKDFQRKWMEIGHVPMKNKFDIQQEFRNAVNANLDKLKIDSIEKSTIGFKSKFENIAHTPGAEHAISKEKSFILGKISAMKNDIKLWENNIGFFANSKKANVLKEEFLEKIERTKQDIKVLEEKLKFLREVK